MNNEDKSYVVRNIISNLHSLQDLIEQENEDQELNLELSYLPLSEVVGFPVNRPLNDKNKLEFIYNTIKTLANCVR